MSETFKGVWMDYIGASLSDLAKQFTIEAIEDIIHSTNVFPLDPKILAISSKAIFGSFISAHFGADVMRNAFELIEVKLWEDFSRLKTVCSTSS
ncbi:unnamed protein product [Microthlaspi erraticum]|uniref:Uncharacterized protein n=1 Tax=Microthlaspi erraticum TaxID=1685480 RepID=A0A6D2IQT8_9BRAS|nr:unnamed protein product [Microthlaspi erraticum]